MPAEILMSGAIREQKILPRTRVAIVQREYDDGRSITNVTSIYNGGEDPTFTTERNGNMKITEVTTLNPGEYTVIRDTPLSVLSRRLEERFIVINKKGRAKHIRYSDRRKNRLLKKGFSYIPSGSFPPKSLSKI